MAANELIGRICVKIAGRDAGAKGVIVAVEDGDYAVVTGPKTLTGLRRRSINIKHLLPTSKKIEIAENYSDEEVLKSIKEAGLEKYMVEKYEV